MMTDDLWNDVDGGSPILLDNTQDRWHFEEYIDLGMTLRQRSKFYTNENT
jgi:hypothetical protein